MQAINTPELENDIFDPDYFIHFNDLLIQQTQVDLELAFIIDRLSIKPSQRILDLPCGYGKYTHALSYQGFDVTGIDINRSFIDHAKKIAENKKLDSKFIELDMRSLNYYEIFEHVLTLNTSWGYFSHSENLSVLEKIKNALVPGGSLFIELMNPHLADYISKGMKNITALDLNGDLFIDWRSYDSNSNRFKIKRVWVKDGNRKNASIEIQNYTLDQMKVIFENLGMKIIDVYGGQKGRPYNQEASRMVLIVKKSG